MSFQVGATLFVLSVNCGVDSMSGALRFLTHLLLEQENIILLLTQASVLVVGESFNISRPRFLHFLFIKLH